MKTTKQLVNAILNDDRGESISALRQIIGSRVNSLLQGRKIQAAQNMFKQRGIDESEFMCESTLKEGAYDGAVIGFEKSKMTGGYRAMIKNKEGKTSYLSQYAWTDSGTAIKAAEVALKRLKAGLREMKLQNFMPEKQVKAN
jgi:hypothetical protein